MTSSVARNGVLLALLAAVAARAQAQEGSDSGEPRRIVVPLRIERHEDPSIGWIVRFGKEARFDAFIDHIVGHSSAPERAIAIDRADDGGLERALLSLGGGKHETFKGKKETHEHGL